MYFIYTSNDKCPCCKKAHQLLNHYTDELGDRVTMILATTEEEKELYAKKISDKFLNGEAFTTVPQIIFSDFDTEDFNKALDEDDEAVYIGGYQELQDYLLRVLED